MKLSDSGGKTSFYETFSDLIFATLAIFVLLMSVFLVQVNMQTGLDEILKEVELKAAERDVAEQRLASRQEEKNKLQQQVQSLENYNLEVVIAVDTTGSMQMELDQLADTIALVGRILPYIAETAKIGVVAYRKDESDQLSIQTFPLSTIRAGDEDGGRSFRSIQSFVTRLNARPGSAPLEEAIDQSLGMFSDPGQFTGHQTLMILGDVGPYEDRYRDQQIDVVNRQQEDAIISQLKNWIGKSNTRNTLILFSGEDEIRKTEGDQHVKFLESRKFFERMANEIGKPESFTVNSAEMVPNLLKAVLG